MNMTSRAVFTSSTAFFLLANLMSPPGEAMFRRSLSFFSMEESAQVIARRFSLSASRGALPIAWPQPIEARRYLFIAPTVLLHSATAKAATSRVGMKRNPASFRAHSNPHREEQSVAKPHTTSSLPPVMSVEKRKRLIVLARTNCIPMLRNIDKRFALNDRSASLAHAAIKVGELAEWITDVQEKNITASNLLAEDYHFSDELLQASIWWRTAMEELGKHDTQSLSAKQKESVKNIERLIVDAKAVKGIIHESLLPF